MSLRSRPLYCSSAVRPTRAVGVFDSLAPRPLLPRLSWSGPTAAPGRVRGTPTILRPSYRVPIHTPSEDPTSRLPVRRAEGSVRGVVPTKKMGLERWGWEGPAGPRGSEGVCGRAAGTREDLVGLRRQRDVCGGPPLSSNALPLLHDLVIELFSSRGPRAVGGGEPLRPGAAGGRDPDTVPAPAPTPTSRSCGRRENGTPRCETWG